MRLQKHVLMNGATGQLAKFLVEIIRNILAGTQSNPKSLGRTWILAEHIIIPPFDFYADDYENVSKYLKQKLSLPEDWIKLAIQDMHNDYRYRTAETKLNAKVLLYQNFVCNY